jgi:hypothetical protein
MLQRAGAPARVPKAPAATGPGLQPSGSPQPSGRAAWLDSVELDFFNLPAAPDWDSCLRYNCSEDKRCRASPPGPVPCCEDKLLQMASDLGSLFAQLNLTYFAGFGTLLGIVRNGSVQPNGVDMDLDFILDAASYDMLASPAQGAMARYALFRKASRPRASSRGIVGWAPALRSCCCAIHTLCRCCAAHKLPACPLSPPLTQGYTVFLDTSLMRVCFNAYSPGMVPVPPKTEGSAIYIDDFKYGDLHRIAPACTRSRPRPIELPRANSRAACTGPELVVRGDPLRSYNESDLFPLRHVVVPGVAVPLPIPARAEAVLTKRYGDWSGGPSTKHGQPWPPARSAAA